MGEQTAIEWTDRTWSPWEGCTKVGPGCDHCYAEARNGRFSRGANWGPGAPRRRRAESGWALPLRWEAELAKRNRQETVFPSLCDPFDNEANEQDRADFWELIDRTPHLMWLLLTKRLPNVMKMLPPHWRNHVTGEQMIPTNVAIGGTLATQADMDRDWQKLWALPTRRLFISIEPMLTPIVIPAPLLARRPWVILGGESGPKARPMHPDWERAVRDQCAAAGAPYLAKQWGEWLPITDQTDVSASHIMAWSDGQQMQQVGKKIAGRLFDGFTHEQFPEWIRRAV